MSVKWLIEDCKHPEDLESLYEILESQNIEYKKATPKDEVLEMYPEGENVVFIGSLQTAQKIKKENLWKPGAYYNVGSFNCNHYYPRFGDFLLNCDYIMLPYGDLYRQKEFLYETLGEDRSIFLRPNREDKIFTGKVIYKEHFDKDIRIFGYGQIDPCELVVAARPINIVQEWRFVCVSGEIVTGSSYKKNNLTGNEAGYPDEALRAAQKAADLYQPDPVWVIDIGLTKSGRYCLVEVGCFSCAGFYSCDRNIIVREISKLNS